MSQFLLSRQVSVIPKRFIDITTPALAMGLRNSNHDWAYKTVMVKRDDYERIEKPNTRGKALGGSSSLNCFKWVPGCKATFDQWAEYGGDEWTWEPLVPYLRKSVTYHDDAKLYSSDFKRLGSGGPIPISHAELIDDMKDFRTLLKRAWKSTDQPLTENIYYGDMNGLTHCCDTIYRGQRSGSYLFVKGKPNITILANVHSKHLIIDRTDLVCMGITVIDPSGKELNFYATREVILSQGVFESPKLLMLSGIGPVQEPARHGLPTIVDSQHCWSAPSRSSGCTIRSPGQRWLRDG